MQMLILTSQIVIVLILLQLSHCKLEANNLYLLQNSQRAKCLDGTPPGYYYKQGSDAGSNKFVLVLEGGFYCNGQSRDEILSNCYSRSQTDLGSSSKWVQYYDNKGFFSSKEQLNPLFYNWNRIYIKYCDGTYFQSSAEPITYKNTTLYFRGNDNIREIIDDINSRFQLKTSQTVVLSGCSAGGQGAYFWAQYLRDYLPESVKMVASPDCGFNVELNDRLQRKNTVFIDLITDGKREIIQPQGCPYLYDDENLYKCMFTEYIIDQINVPMFFISSLYDSFFIQSYLGVNCINKQNALENCSSADLDKIEKMRSKMYDLITKISQKKNDWGMWAVSCVLHVFSWTSAFNNQIYEVPMDITITPALALKAFVEATEQGSQLNNFYFVDSLKYPYNTKCNGLPSPSAH